MPRLRSGIVLGCTLLSAAPAAHADEPAIRAAIRDFFTAGPARRAALVAQIQSDPAYDRSRVPQWLHEAGLFEPREPGLTHVTVPIDTGETRTVALRIPPAYDARKPYPLVYALHGTGGTGEAIIPYVERLLGDAAGDYLIAAPTGYGQAVIHSPGPPSAEHLQILLSVRKAVHVDCGRVFVAGYSLGGHAAWTLAVLHADEFAGAIPVAGSLILPELDRLWPTMLPNVANTHVLAAWGAKDTADAQGGHSTHGGIAGLNRRLDGLLKTTPLPITLFEDLDKGHGGVLPPRDEVAKLLARRRICYPPRVRHAFRYEYQARCYWIEGHDWRGEQWDRPDLKVDLKPGEDTSDAIARAFRSRLGELAGTVEGQTVSVSRKKIGELTIWFGDGMIAWDQPVVVKVSGRKVYEGPVAPDLHVCLSEAARTWDFARLRWAGLRFKSGSKADWITPE